MTPILRADAEVLLLGCLADAKQCGKSVLQGSLYLQVFLRVRLAEDVAPLGVADHDKVKPQLLQHQRGDLSCELTLVLPAHILGAQLDIGAVHVLCGALQSSVGGDDEELHLLPADILCQGNQVLQIFYSVLDVFVHLEIASEIQFLLHYSTSFPLIVLVLAKKSAPEGLFCTWIYYI